MSFLSHSRKSVLYDFVYQLPTSLHDKGHVLFKQYEKADKIVIVLNGVCEVFTEMEGNEFVIERLHPGSVIN